MKTLVVSVALFFVLFTSAHASTWKPGSPAYITSTFATDIFEGKFDHGFCVGIPRLGHLDPAYGEYEDRYLYFDCSGSLNGTFCSDIRYRAIKSSPRNYYQLKVVKKGSCF